MLDKIKVSFGSDRQLFGSSQYILTVHVTNSHKKNLTDIEVEPLVVPGVILSQRVESKDIEISEQESERLELLKALTRQLESSYARQMFKKMKLSSRLLYSYARAIQMYASIITLEKNANTFLLPSYVSAALRVKDWEDAERLEKEFVDSMPEDQDKFKKIFAINKSKLKKNLETTPTGGPAPVEQEDSGYVLPPGATISFPFTVRSPMLFRPRSYDAQFKVSIKDSESGNIVASSYSHTLNFFASQFSIPLGGLAGALVGYVIKVALVTAGDPSTNFNWWRCGASVLLGLLVAVFAARSPNDKKAITAEDFVGGFIIGAVTAIFSDEAIARLSAIAKTK